MVSTDRIQQINHDILGPIFYRFFYKLYLGQRCLPAGQSTLLFLSRGGIRLRAFYETFLQSNGVDSPHPYSDFYISRMAIIKANLVDNYNLVIDDFLREYSWLSVDDALKAFLQPEEYDAWRRCEQECDITLRLDRSVMDMVLWGTGVAAEYLRSVLTGESNKYRRYLDEVLGDCHHVIVVDTGWSGSILRYMQAADPGRDYLALLFGRYNYGNPSPPWFAQVVGLEIQHRGFDPAIPMTSIFLNRHLIEGACEIRWPSVTGYRVGSGGRIESHEGTAPPANILPDASEPHALGIQQYIQNASSGLNLEAIDREADKAARKLLRYFIYPRPGDLPVFSFGSRSADFGKDINVSYFRHSELPRYAIRAKWRQANRSLWPSGQLALEFRFCRPLAQYLYYRFRLLKR